MAFFYITSLGRQFGKAPLTYTVLCMGRSHGVLVHVAYLFYLLLIGPIIRLEHEVRSTTNADGSKYKSCPFFEVPKKATA